MDERQRWIVTLDRDAIDAALDTIDQRTELSRKRIASSTDFADSAVDESAGDDGFVLRKLGVAVLHATPDQAATLAACCDGNGAVVGVAQERVVHLAPTAAAPLGAPSREWLEWWPERTGVLRSHGSGRDVRVAVIDSGIDLGHPDFTNRRVVLPQGQMSHDGHGHGTSLAALACGNRVSAEGIRYGIAFEADLFVWKAVTDDGKLAEGGLQAGIEWALADPQNCDLVCLSWTWSLGVGQASGAHWEAIGKTALDQDCLIVAAAGNDSARPALRKPVGGPADCPSIFACGALGRNLDVWRTSNAGLNPSGEVNVVGPGEDVYTATSRDLGRTHTLISQTSAAMGFVTGIAALHAHLTGLRGRNLWRRIETSAENLPGLDASDVGYGLTVAP